MFNLLIFFQFQQVFSQAFPDSSLDNRLILDIDLETKKPLVSVHEDIVKQLKEHQVRF